MIRLWFVPMLAPCCYGEARQAKPTTDHAMCLLRSCMLLNLSMYHGEMILLASDKLMLCKLLS